MKKHRWIRWSFPLLLLIAIYILGPAPERPEFSSVLPVVPRDADGLESYVHARESHHRIKPGNEAQIVWNDSSRSKTEYAVVYLHGFSASRKEGDPVHRRFAKQFGSNLFLSRLSDHGIDTTESLLYFTADRAWESAKEALVIGEQLGRKVILMSTSTGGTLALKLAATYPEKVYALINLSPNIAINDPAAFLLNDPWGLQIARVVMGGKYRTTESDEEESKYWNSKYRLEAVVQLEELIESTMTPVTFRAVSQPSLTLYYYKNEAEQDSQVKVGAMLEMHKQLATPEPLKKAVAVPAAGAHVLGSSLVSKDVEGVYAQIKKFAETTLHMHARAHSVLPL